MTNPSVTRNRSPLMFFLLVFVLSVPLWLMGAFTPLQLMPGLPMSSLMVLAPVISALYLSNRENGTVGVLELLKNPFRLGRIRSKVWFLPVLLLMPGIAVLAYAVMRWFQVALPEPEFHVLSALVMFLVFFVAALCEEIGWSGYAIDPLQNRWNALQGAVFLGVIWAVWHIVPFIQAQRSVTWIAWQCLMLVASRVLLVWLYNNTGKSILAAALCHTMINVSWQLFPVQGSHYDPRTTALFTMLVAIVVVIVYGPQTLVRSRAD